MAILHRAWTFDAAALAGRVASIVRAGGAPALRETARWTVAAGDAGTAAALGELRFDSDWLAPPDELSARAVESVVIILAAQLTHAPSIAGHVKLGRVLLECGWTGADVGLLFHGRALETMFDVSADRELARCIAGINQYGGWIPHDDAISLRRRLEGLPPAVPAKQALQEARAMLAAAEQRAADLFVILD
jgi:hypothetical protein